MSSLHHVNSFKGKEKARLPTTGLEPSFSTKPSSEVASLGIDEAYPSSQPSSGPSSALAKPPVGPLQSGQMESLIIADDKTGAAVLAGLGANTLLASVAEGPINTAERYIPEADTSTASLAPTSTPLTDSVVVSGAVMSTEQAILLHAPHAVEPVILGPFSGSQNVMVMNSTINMTNNVKMGQNTPDLVSLKPNSSTLFTGRKEVLKQLKHHFAPRVDRERRLFLLHGMGGIGKTQICLRFAEEMSDLIPQVFWVDASSTDTIILSLKVISGDADSSAPSTLQRIAALENEWLLVFDNADGGPEVVEKFLPPGSKGNILITSRNYALERITLVENSLGLPEMAKEDAVILLQKSSCLVSLVKDYPNLAEKIVSELCCLPLAVDQAGAAIHSGLCDVHKYLENLSYQRERLMSHPLFRGASQYDRTVYGTFELSYGEIEARATRPNPYVANSAQTAILILQTCASYHYDNISKDIFKHAAEKSRQRDVENEIKSGLPLAITSLDYRLLPVDKNGHWDDFFFNQGLQVLLSFSLIKRSSSSDVFAMHPLVHSWSQDRMSELAKHQSCKMGRTILCCATSIGEKVQDFAHRQRLLPHINANLQYGAQMGLEHIYKDDEYVRFAKVFQETGEWKKEKLLVLELVKKRKKILGPEHPHTLSSISNLALTYNNQGHWQKAEELQVQVLEIRNKVLGSEHPNTLTSMNDLATTYLRQGHWQRAEELQVQVLESCNYSLGSEHPNILTSVNNLASTYGYQGYWQRAEELQVQVLKLTEKVLGLEHLTTLICMNNLATTYQSQGHWQRAEELQVQVLELTEKVLGSEHPTTLTCMNNLATTYRNQGYWQRAEELQVQVLELTEKVLGLEHPNTLTSMNNLATTYRNQGHWQRAEELQVQVLELTKKVLGSEHPDTLTCISNLATTYQSQGHWKKAEKLQVHVHELMEKVLGLEHPNTLTSMNNLATTYRNQGHWQRAEELQVQVLELTKKVLGSEHPDTLTCISNLATTYQSQGHWKKAEKLQVQVLKSRKNWIRTSRHSDKHD
ncbi:hypothetical protein B0H34DRAFT_860108 [Crassisporium funariophilum]|nr:hypothetical protein B0H34DRAFT_863717 [Crassisporium funariophilum]KAF8155836.1 hypothetical protein B0H34DRAFT_860108 [Crassisporium funariophilum]